MGGGGQYSRSPRSGKASAAVQGASNNSQHQYQAASGGPLMGLPPPQVPGMLSTPPMGTGLLGAPPGHASLLGPPPPITPGGSVPSPQGGGLHSAPSVHPPHMLQAPQSHSSSGSSYIVELSDLSGALSLEEMTERIRSCGFPQSCDFVLQLLDRFVQCTFFHYALLTLLGYV